jgi:hypothetical protein
MVSEELTATAPLFFIQYNTKTNTRRVSDSVIFSEGKTRWDSPLGETLKRAFKFFQFFKIKKAG